MTAEGMHVETTDDHYGHADFGWGSCTFHAQPEGLALHLQARDAVMLERAQQALSSHLEQFGRRDNLTVTWTAPANH